MLVHLPALTTATLDREAADALLDMAHARCDHLASSSLVPTEAGWWFCALATLTGDVFTGDAPSAHAAVYEALSTLLLVGEGTLQ